MEFIRGYSEYSYESDLLAPEFNEQMHNGVDRIAAAKKC